MQQRVGIARAFALGPKELLLELWETDRRTVIMVTHDVEEAVQLSDRIFVMSHGPAATIIDRVDVPFARPRDQAALRRDPAFHDMVAGLVAQLTAPVRGGATGDV